MMKNKGTFEFENTLIWEKEFGMRFFFFFFLANCGCGD